MALALYRKYRPATFAEVVGQEHVTDPLRASLRAQRINHAYLFSGPRGCGKTSSARILARSLNCVQGPTDEPCGECQSCVALAPNGPGSVDVVELDAASHGGVDDARELRDKAFYAPAESTYRVFVIDEAHMVTTQGFNALLKVVEEPPEHLIFIFATTEPEKVLATIRSRTHHYPFRLIPPQPMRSLLEQNCAAEDITVEPAVFPLVIRAGGGSARDTQSIMDQLLAGAGPDGVTYQRAVALLGVTDVALLDSIADGLAAGDAAAVFGTVQRVVEAGHDPRRFASDLLDRFRDLVLMQAVPDAAERGLVAEPADQLTAMDKQARDIGGATLTRYAEILHTGLTEMRGATAPRLLLELLCSRMLLPSSTDEESAVLQRVERLERRLTAGSEAVEVGSQDPPKFQRPSERARAEAAAANPGPTNGANTGGAAKPDRRAEPRQEAAQQQPSPEPDAPGPSARPERGESAEQAAARTQQSPAQEPGAQEPGAPRSEQAQPAPEAQQQETGEPEQPAPEESRAEPSTAGPSTAGPSTAEPEPTADAEPAPEPEQPTADAEPVVDAEPAAGQQAGSMDAAAVRSVWSEVLTAVRAGSRSVEAMLAAATVQRVEGNTIELAHTAAPLVKRLSEPHNVEVLAGALTTALGGQWQVRWVHGEGTAAPKQQEQPKARRTFEPPQRTKQSRQQTQREPSPPSGGVEPEASAPDEPAGDPEPGPPPEPQPEPEPVAEEDMLAEAARPLSEEERANQRSPEEQAIDLLSEQLGARKIGGEGGD